MLILAGALGLFSTDSIFASGVILKTIQILAILLMIWARITFGSRSFHAAANPTEGGLVTTGPYKFIRHPIYAFIFYFVWASFISHVGILNLVFIIIVNLGIALRIIAEEHLIVKRYPEYAGYSARTKRIIPYIF